MNKTKEKLWEETIDIFETIEMPMDRKSVPIIKIKEATELISNLGKKAGGFEYLLTAYKDWNIHFIYTRMRVDRSKALLPQVNESLLDVGFLSIMYAKMFYTWGAKYLAKLTPTRYVSELCKQYWAEYYLEPILEEVCHEYVQSDYSNKDITAMYLFYRLARPTELEIGDSAQFIQKQADRYKTKLNMHTNTKFFDVDIKI